LKLSPFPEGLTPDIPAAEYADEPRAQRIAAAARRLDELRNNWLNPPDLVMRVPEVVSGQEKLFSYFYDIISCPHLPGLASDVPKHEGTER
jgi:hypothetical protein